MSKLFQNSISKISYFLSRVDKNELPLKLKFISNKISKNNLFPIQLFNFKVSEI
jgi:hypothetical protein